MEKVKVTVDQARELDSIIGPFTPDEVVQMVLDGCIGRLTQIYKLPQLDLIKAVYIGYEIEEEYKSGDWVYHINGHVIGKVVRVKGNKIEVIDKEGDTLLWMLEYVRHATPEEIKAEQERRVWAKIGREVGEFVRGDAGLHKNGQTIRSTSALSTEYAMDNLKGFHPAESFISFGGGEE